MGNGYPGMYGIGFWVVTVYQRMTDTRKLAAIVAADVVGYSRLAGTDEERTLARLPPCGAI